MIPVTWSKPRTKKEKDMGSKKTVDPNWKIMMLYFRIPASDKPREQPVQTRWEGDSRVKENWRVIKQYLDTGKTVGPANDSWWSWVFENKFELGSRHISSLSGFVIMMLVSWWNKWILTFYFVLLEVTFI